MSKPSARFRRRLANEPLGIARAERPVRVTEPEAFAAEKLTGVPDQTREAPV